MPPNHSQPSKQDFIDAVQRAFEYLVREFHFEPEPIPLEDRDVWVAYSNARMRVVVEGTNWGLNTRVALGRSNPDGRFENYDLQDLIALRGPDAQPLLRRGSVETGSAQIDQVPYLACALRAVGQDVLLGDFTVFPALQTRVDQRRAALRNAQP